MRNHRIPGPAWMVAAVLVFFVDLHARELSFEQRVAAQRALDRVYFAHQDGNAGSFDDALPREQLERKVRTVLAKSAALEQLWKTPVTAEMLEREVERMARETRLPDRLAELFAALGNDSYLVQECLARPLLVDRLIRGFHAADECVDHSLTSGKTWDDWWAEREARFASIPVPPVAASGWELPDLASRHTSLATSCSPSEGWEPFADAEPPEPRNYASVVWTGTWMIVWGGQGPQGQLYTSGGRYDPATDTWSPMSVENAPAGRALHTAVWTGSEMIVWGGWTPAPLSSGGRYDPITDTWTPPSATNAPLARYHHTAVWVGGRMVVWGGTPNNATSYQSGGRYDPATDSWTATSTVAAPLARTGHTAVAAGSSMIVWGGYSSTYLGIGGRYDPASDTWTTVSVTGAPSPRFLHGAVWTGSRMIVWGGSDGSGVLGTGGSYDPVGNQWSPVTTSGAPAPRSRPISVWTGSLMVILDSGGSAPGGRYDPQADAWQPVSTVNAPAVRYGVWGGNRVIGWGDLMSAGGRYDPVADTWTATSLGNGPSARGLHTAVWTGSKMLIWGGASDPTGGQYDPATGSWTPTSLVNAPTARSGHTAVWTGSRMIVWGGNQVGTGLVATGARYDPLLDAWQPTSTIGAPSARGGHTAIWTGGQMIVWSGAQGAFDYATGGGRYDPALDAWTAISTTNAPGLRDDHTAVWTGSRMIVWGGKYCYNPRFPTCLSFQTGGQYDPVADAWTPTATGANVATQRDAHTAIWTGSRMIVWGGEDWGFGYPPAGGAYDPASNTWTSMSTSGGPTARTGHRMVWTGSRLIVWGGYTGSPSDTGGIYDLQSDTWVATPRDGPQGRSGHSAVWTPAGMLVWGGNGQYQQYYGSGWRLRFGDSIDDDGDSFSECGGDCDDASAVTHPGAPELCNGIDDDCSGFVDDGVAPPSQPPALTLTALPAGVTRLAWPAVAGATEYDVVRGSMAALSATAGDFSAATDACVAQGIASAPLDDGTVPETNAGLFWLVRARNCGGDGSYDVPGGAQAGGRDAGVAASPGACP